MPRHLLAAALVSLLAFPALAEPPAPPSPAGTPALVLLKDGQQLRGRLVAQDAAGVTLELEGGARVLVPAASIERVDVARPGQTAVRSNDPNRTRYLYSPSAFMLKRGEGYVSQTELLVTSVAYGLTDHLTVGLGTSIPFLFVEDGVNVIGTLRVGGALGEHVRLAGGVQGLWFPGIEAGTTVGFLFGTVTVGSPDLHLSLSAGPPFVAGDLANDVGDVILAVAGTARVSEHFALVSENWIVPDGGYLLSGAVRFIGQRLGVDAGLLWPEGAEMPIPWLDFTWNFGTR